MCHIWDLDENFVTLDYTPANYMFHAIMISSFSSLMSIKLSKI
jgi:hypothetical protein